MGARARLASMVHAINPPMVKSPLTTRYTPSNTRMTLVNCWMQVEPLLMEAESSLSLPLTSVRNVALFSHLRCIYPSIPSAFTVSRPTRLSIRVALRIAPARNMVSESACILVCTLKEYTSMMRAPMATGITICQAIQAITAKKISANGISISVVIVAEVMKSRTVSKERRLEAKEPTELGRCSRRVPSTFSMIREDNLMSTRWLAQSRKYPRMVRRMKSAQTTSDTPMTSTQSVSTDLLGTIRSYTFIVKIGIASANILMSKATSMMSRYRWLFSASVPQNQCLRRTLPTAGARLSNVNLGFAAMA